jgi:hypothetical protein
MTFEHILPGDTVCRLLGGMIPMDLLASEVTDTEILCGERNVGWMFCRKTGAEIDPELGWGAPPLHTGSFLVEDV